MRRYLRLLLVFWKSMVLNELEYRANFILTKPVNSQFHTSLRELALWSAPDFAIGAAVLIYGLVAAGAQPTPVQLVLFVLLLGAAALMLYSLVLMLATSAF